MNTSIRILLLTTAAILLPAIVGCSAGARQDRHLARARTYHAAGELEKAELEYINVLRLNNGNADALAGIGSIYYDQGRIGRVFSFLNKAKELKPDNLEVRTKLGRVLFNGGKLKDARDEALFVLKHRQADGEAAMLLADASVTPAEIEEARRQLTPLASQSKDRVPVLLALGVLDLKQRNRKGAEAHFERARALDPNSGLAHLGIATLRRTSGDVEGYREALATASKLSPPRSTVRVQHARVEMHTGHLGEARRILEETIKSTPDYLTPYLALAEVALAENKLDECLDLLGKVLVREPSQPDAMAFRAEVYMRKGQSPNAVADLERAVEMYPQSAPLRYQLGLAHVGTANLSKAMLALGEAIRLQPDFPRATLLLGDVQARQGNLTAAIATLKALAQSHPEMRAAKVALARAHARQGNLDEALATLREIDQRFPKNPETSLQIGSVLVQQSKPEEARKAFDRAIELAPEYTAAWEQLVVLELQQKNHAPLLNRLRGEIAKRPKFAALHILLARVQVAAADTPGAIATLENLIQLQPDGIVPYVALARLYMKSGEQDRAIANLKQAATSHPEAPEPLMLLALLYEAKKDYAAARESYEKALQLNPAFSPVLNNLAYLYAQHFNNPEKALELAQRAHELQPNDPHTADTLAWILHKRGQYPRALSLLTASAEKLPDSAELQYHLGMTHYMLGQEEPARTTLESALRLGDSFVGVEDARRALEMLMIDPATATDEMIAALEKTAANRPDPVVLFRLGAIYEKRGEAAKASDAFEQALKSSPGNVRAALGAIRVHRSQKATAKAFELAKSARKTDPASPEIAEALGSLAFETGDYRWAYSLLQEAIRTDSVNPDTLFTYAQAAYLAGQVTATEATLGSLLEKSPSYARLDEAREYLEMVRLATDAAKAAEAAERIERAALADTAPVPAIMALGNLKMQQRDTAAALAAWNRALAKFPQFPLAQRELAILHSENPTPDRAALELAARARDAFPADTTLAKAYGMLQFRSGNFEHAAALLEEAARARSQDAEVLYFLGMAQNGAKRRSEAVANLNKALALDLRPELAAKAKQVVAETP